jgi:Xaa-Pro aminopeptidase
LAWSEHEYSEKVARVRALSEKNGLQGVLLTSQTNFYWLTGGLPYVNTAAEKACADLLVTIDKVYLLSNNIEAERLAKEQLSGLPLEKISYNWWESEGLNNEISKIIDEKKMATDTRLGGDFSRIRWDLTAQELTRYRDVGRRVGQILEDVAFQIKPGMSEQEIADSIKMAAILQGVQANVALVAVDERTFLYRHPVPTEKRLKQYAMLCLSGQRQGLYVSASRLVHFGAVPEDVRKRFEAVIKVDAAFIGATVPGAIVKAVFAKGLKAYEAVGFGQEWTRHHQGGMAGYNSREFRAGPALTEIIRAGQAYAWNPTIAGVKSEDTVIVTETGPEILSSSPLFPVIEVEVDNRVLKRPDILIR